MYICHTCNLYNVGVLCHTCHLYNAGICQSCHLYNIGVRMSYMSPVQCRCMSHMPPVQSRCTCHTCHLYNVGVLCHTCHLYNVGVLCHTCHLYNAGVCQYMSPVQCRCVSVHVTCTTCCTVCLIWWKSSVCTYRTGSCWQHTEQAAVGSIQNRQLLAAYPNLTSPNNTTHEQSHTCRSYLWGPNSLQYDTSPTVGIGRGPPYTRRPINTEQVSQKKNKKKHHTTKWLKAYSGNNFK